MSASSEVLVAQQIVKGYASPAGYLPVLQSLDLRVQSGEMLAITGASGVGKSTLLHVLGTLDRPESGALFHTGEDVTRFSEPELRQFRNRKLGFVFQMHHLLPEFTALENVMMPLLIARRPLREARLRARQLLEDLGMRNREEHRPSMLSGGEQQRVAVARALINQPKLILADEPTGNLDEANEQTVLALMQDLHASGHTILVVTHSPAIGRMADRRIELAHGRLSQIVANVG
jgi:lipoprotein-releasing system ATP-binding protein